MTGAAVSAEETVAVDADKSVAESVVRTEAMEGAIEARSSPGMLATVVGKMNESADSDERGDFMGMLDSCMVLSRMSSWAWGATGIR